MKHFSIIFVLVILVVFASTSYAQIDSTLAQQLQDTLDYVCSLKNIKGASTAVVMPDQEIWTGVNGITHDTVKIKPGMLFGIASITKNYTALLILKLAEEGILTLEDSLHEWLPTYNNIDSTITIRQLLNMTSGIYDYVNDNPSFGDSLFSDLSRAWTPEEIITKLVGPPHFPPGTMFRYSQTNYILLGMIIKKATGSSISDELRNRFFNPLNLNATFFSGEDTLIGEIAHPNPYYNGSFHDYYFMLGAANSSLLWTGGAMFATAQDVAQWAKALFGGAVLNQYYTNQMVTFGPISHPSPLPPEWTGYGLGAYQFNILNRELWGGVGLWWGYVALVAYLPGDGISIAVLLNERYDGSVNFTMRNAHDILAALLGTVIDYVSDVEVDNTDLPFNYILKQNYPNPFNPSTTFEFALPHSGFVTLKVYNIMGEEVVTLVSERLTAGSYKYDWNANGLASGVYVYKFQTSDYIETKKIILLR
jgi:D-alanyl-D-alanine carboxypeptidase